MKEREELISNIWVTGKKVQKLLLQQVTDPNTELKLEVTETIGTYTRSQKVMGDWKPPSNENKADTGSACYRKFQKYSSTGFK